MLLAPGFIDSIRGKRIIAIFIRRPGTVCRLTSKFLRQEISASHGVEIVYGLLHVGRGGQNERSHSVDR